MPFICYKNKRFTDQYKDIISKANAVLNEYAAQGYSLTLRQLYYKFVARDLFPAYRRYVYDSSKGKWVNHKDGTTNCDLNYKWLGNIINDGRMAGLIDWDYLEDRTRSVRMNETFTDGRDALRRLAGWYHIDMWENQKVRPEVWIEKDALVGVIEKTCKNLDVPYFSCRGYTSQSEMWQASQRLLAHKKNGYDTHIIHLGDHDPSGIDMSRDIFDRLEVFMGGVAFERVALNMDQVEQYAPPPDPAKLSDSRCKAYVENYGSSSWELDALEPATINGLIDTAIKKLRDEDQFKKDVARKQEEREKLTKCAEAWGIKLQRFSLADDAERLQACVADVTKGPIAVNDLDYAVIAWLANKDGTGPIHLEEKGEWVRYRDIAKLLGHKD